MTRFSALKTFSIALGVAAMAVTATPAPVKAQGFFQALFGGIGNGRGIAAGNPNIGGRGNVIGTQSGKQMVSFDTHYAPGQIVISFSDRRLYHIVARGKAASYPIGVPAGKAAWTGVERVSRKVVNPRWTPTPDMRKENPNLPAYVPGGTAMNPLGVRAMYLGNTMYRIHGTDAPGTVGRDVSHGCIRLYNRDVVELYNKIGVGTKVTVTYKRFH